jgi:DUF2946 family protein
MKLLRFISVFSVILFALHGAGVVRTLHNISHHAQPSTSHSCNDAQSHNTPTNQAPTEQPSDSDDEDHDCDICLTLNSITPTQDAPQLTTLPLAPKGELFKITNQTLHYSAQRPGDKAARAPPIS